MPTTPTNGEAGPTDMGSVVTGEGDLLRQWRVALALRIDTKDLSWMSGSRRRTWGGYSGQRAG